MNLPHAGGSCDRKEREWTPKPLPYENVNAACALPDRRLLIHGTSFSLGRSKPTEPPSPFPLPPFVPIESTRIQDEVTGLLRPRYKSRFDALAQSQVVTSKPLNELWGTTSPASSGGGNRGEAASIEKSVNKSIPRV